MTTKELNKIEIINELNLLSEKNIYNVKLYLEFILNRSKVKLPKSKSLKGIWKNIGFDRIENLQNEIDQIRKENSQIY